MKFNPMFVFFFILLFHSPQVKADPLLLGYYSNWAQFRPKPGDFKPDDLKPIIGRLTDIHYAYLFFNYNAQTRFPTNDWKIQFTEFNDSAKLSQVVALAGSKNVFVSVGGWDFNDPYHPYGQTTYPFFSEMVAAAANYNPFIQSAISLCEQYKLAGVCIEWEFPGVPNQGGNTNDYQNLATFIKAFGSQMSAKGFKVRLAVPGTAPPNFEDGEAIINDPTPRLYSITSTDNQSYIDWLSSLSQYVDLFYIMCYDYFGPTWQPNNGLNAFPLTGENAPLNPNPTISPVNNSSTCITQTLTSYTNNSQYSDQPTPLDKIVIGVPAYGRTFRGLKFPGNLTHQPFGPGAEFTDPDSGGYYTKLPGFLSYYEVQYNLCNYYKHTQTNPVTQTAYAWSEKNKLWVSFDNKATAKNKGQYIISKNLAGGGVWTLDDDNFFDENPFNITNGLADGLGIPP